MKQLLLVALMVLVSMVGMTVVSPVTAVADDREIPGHRSDNDDNGPPGRAGDHKNREVLEMLSTILENQQRLLNKLNKLQNTTLPNQGDLLSQIKDLQTSILANGQSLLNQVDTIQNTTFPNQARLLNEVISTQGLVLEQMDGLQLACTTPDLLPKPLPGGEFCRTQIVGEGTPQQKFQLLVRVHNQGGGNAGASTTSVFFRVPDNFQFSDPYYPCAASGCAGVDLPTDSLAGFTGTTLAFDIPGACYGIDNICQFKIAADSVSIVPESDEANNNNAGVCFGVIL
jgi:hypothetical protein